jgi:hypothetical protein
MEALPQAQQGDRPAFLAALRFVWCQLRNQRNEAEAVYEEMVRFLGNASTAQFLLLEVERLCVLENSWVGKPAPPTTPLFVAFGRVCALGDDMGMSVDLIDDMPEYLIKELSSPGVSADPRILAALGEAAMRDYAEELAYVVAGVGLALGADHQGRFLFLRARSLPPSEENRRSSCLAAASELARRHHDADLLSRIGEWRNELMDWMDAPDAAKTAIGSEGIAAVVQGEIEARDFPQSRPAFAPDDDDYDEECQCPECCAARGELPEMPPEFVEMVERMGPDAVAQALAEMLGIGGKKKRRRRSPFADLYGDDSPF